MDRERMLGHVEVVGETLVVVGAVAWLPMRGMAPWLFVAGVVFLALGRLLQTPFYQKYPVSDPRELTLRRLYHQRVFGIVALVLAAVLMCMPVGFHAGMYVGATSWLVPFVFFVVVEVYSVFRFSALEKD